MVGVFEAQYHKLQEEIREVKNKADLAVVFVTDSHLSDNTEQTCNHIRRIDETVGFNCVVHTGDLLNGNNPERVSRKNLREAIDLFRNSIGTKAMYIARGNHDGWRDESYKGQTVCDIMVDEKWVEDTNFMDDAPNFHRVSNKPYFYVDFPEKKIRFVILSTNYQEHDVQNKVYKNYAGFCDDQIHWLGKEALVTKEDGWSILLFSHIPPLTEHQGLRPDGWRNPMSDRGGADVVALINACKVGGEAVVKNETYGFSGRKTNILCWCFGHVHGDMLQEKETINFVGLASQTAYVPQLWDVPFGEFPSPRECGQVSEDCWDSVFVCLQERKIYFFRFGAGNNRVVSF